MRPEWERCSTVYAYNTLDFFFPVLFTLTFIVLVKLCNDVTSPFLRFLFPHPCFATVVSQLETRALISS